MSERLIESVNIDGKKYSVGNIDLYVNKKLYSLLGIKESAGQFFNNLGWGISRGKTTCPKCQIIFGGGTDR